MKHVYSPDYVLEIEVKAAVLRSGADTFAALTVTDNGGGFRTGSAVSESEKKGRPSIGLKNIAGRIELSGGAFRIASCIGLGTTARIILSMKGDDQT